jgi:hypothetical protein
VTRFADPKATARMVLRGGCQCEGQPHDEDWIEMRTQLGSADALVMASGRSLDALELLIVAWNLRDGEGREAPVDREHIDLLFADTFDEMDAWIEKNVRFAQLPNASGAHSANGSRASASSPRGTKTGR